MWRRMKKKERKKKNLWWLGPHSSSGSAVSASFSLHPSSAQTRTLHHESRTNVLTLILSPPAGLISFQPQGDGYLRRSWQTIVFTIFFSQANKSRGRMEREEEEGGAGMLLHQIMCRKKKSLMIPIYNSRLNNDTVKSWQAVINGGSYKTYLVWRMAEDELHGDTNPW